MNGHNRIGVYAGLTSLVLVSAMAGTALAQTKTFPPGTDCSQLSGSDMAACQNQQANQQRDGTVGNGATPLAPDGDSSTDMGTGNNAVPNNAPANGSGQSNGTNGGATNGGTGAGGANTTNP